MKIVQELKQFWWLRRIALASERQAEIFEKILHILESEQSHPKPPRKPSEFAIMDQEAINKDWLRRMEADRDGIELED